MPGFLADDEVRTRSGSIFREGSENVDPDWLTAAVTDANLRAWDALLSAMTVRGFTAAQILLWPAGRSYQGEIALFLLSVRGRLDLASETGVGFLELADPRPELALINPTNAGGIPIKPTQPPNAPGPVGFSTGPKDRCGRPVRGDRAFDRHHGGFIRW
jgi:hypothetical protein